MLGVSNQVVILSGFNQQDVPRGNRLSVAVDLDPTPPLHDHEDFVIRMFLLGTIMSTEAPTVKTQSALEDVVLRTERVGDVRGSANPKIT